MFLLKALQVANLGLSPAWEPPRIAGEYGSEPCERKLRRLAHACCFACGYTSQEKRKGLREMREREGEQDTRTILR